MKTKEELVNEALDKISSVGVLCAMCWLASEMEKRGRPSYGAAGAYHNGSPEQRAKIDAAIAQADGIISSERVTRDRRKSDLPYQADGMPDRRQADRRDKPHRED